MTELIKEREKLSDVHDEVELNNALYSKEYTEIVASIIDIEMDIGELAKYGYALAQYWMGCFAIKREYFRSKDDEFAYASLAVDWYKKPLIRGVPRQKNSW